MLLSDVLTGYTGNPTLEYVIAANSEFCKNTEEEALLHSNFGNSEEIFLGDRAESELTLESLLGSHDGKSHSSL